MKGIGSDLFDPRTVMESDYSRGASSSDADFGFAFNDSNFSDRILRIEIMGEPDETRTDAEGCNSIADWVRHRKRRREDIRKESVLDLTVCPDEQILNGNQPDMDDCVVCENQDEEAVAMVEEVASGDEAANSFDSSWSMDCSTVVKVKSLHISSPILAAKSPFFYKLFSNGMRESEQRHVTLRINASEEAALMELLNFMYSNTLSTTMAPALLDVLMAADKFEVASCMRYCSRLLRKMPMTPESALLYLELPSSVLMAEAVQPLTDAAKQYLAARYKDITKFQQEVMALPLAGVEAVLSSDDLQIASEDAVYDFVLKWARTQYPKLEERREVLCSRLARLIRFPYMTCRKLKKVLTCNDFDHDVASKLVLEALFFKAEAPHRQRTLAAEESGLNRRFVERAYKYRPVKVVEFELPRQQCVVYLDLKREECANLFPSGRVYSQAFHLGGQGFFLSAHCNMDQQSSFHCFGLVFGNAGKGLSEFCRGLRVCSKIKANRGVC
ncbi:BTB/POZ domain-containing POB1-like protein [Quillaja saponaria]|uniref:BTB/POZ domain-containing POB1-like protein n=1 Tax=Quillaja saponaria TaxID=32244 RepID=A0AAD7LQV1_QUISA|nr:BTB/POZ domain-containing POB1-like protein [Quillaja saponaria]